METEKDDTGLEVPEDLREKCKNVLGIVLPGQGLFSKVIKAHFAKANPSWTKRQINKAYQDFVRSDEIGYIAPRDVLKRVRRLNVNYPTGSNMHLGLAI